MLQLISTAAPAVTDAAAFGYMSADMQSITTSDGAVLGAARVIHSWRIKSRLSDRMYQVECFIDGRTYTGRAFGALMSWHGKVAVERKSSGFALLTRPEAQPKAVKGEKKGVTTFVLHLAPADLSGHEVCSMRTDACTFCCLNTAGRGHLDSVQSARIRKTQLYFSDRALFMQLLVSDIRKATRYAKRRGMKAAFRLNGTSDIPWHRVAIVDNGVTYTNVMELFPGETFYDYTKVAKRILKETLPRNYSLAFSLTENNDAVAAQVLARGGNVAAIFRNRKLSEALLAAGSYTIGGFIAPLVDGDETDLRFFDPAGSIIALYAKGTKAKRDQSGMVRDQ
jgi:hypothetical protein